MQLLPFPAHARSPDVRRIRSCDFRITFDSTCFGYRALPVRYRRGALDFFEFDPRSRRSFGPSPWRHLLGGILRLPPWNQTATLRGCALRNEQQGKTPCVCFRLHDTPPYLEWIAAEAMPAGSLHHTATKPEFGTSEHEMSTYTNTTQVQHLHTVLGSSLEPADEKIRRSPA